MLGVVENNSLEVIRLLGLGTPTLAGRHLGWIGLCILTHARIPA